MYSLTADIVGQAPKSAELALHTKTGRTILPWPHIAPVEIAPSAQSPKATGSPAPESPQEAKLWFERETDDVLGVRVAAAGDISCSSPAMTPSSAKTYIPVVTVYDESTHHETLPEQSPLDHIPTVTDAMFVRKEPLQYPSTAQGLDVSGTVVVGVEIGSDGKAIYGWVRARDEGLKSQTILDNPALWSALKSTYVPQRVDGKPATSVYYINYEFVLDDPESRKPADIDYFKECPAILETFRVSVSDKSDQTQWYSLSMNANGSNLPTSVVLGLQDAQNKSTGMIWNAITYHEDPSAPAYYFAEGSFNSKGSPITLAWVDQATMNDGKVIDCEPVSDAPFNLADGTEFPRYVAGDALPLLSMQQVQPADFTREVWPEYPIGKNGMRDAGFVVVQTVVDETGTIRESFLTQSSGLRSLDSAALYAATSSDYQSAAPGGVALYEAVYQFVP
jgi:TonB family protein